MENICKFCNKICKNKHSLTQHQIRCKNNPNKIDTSKSINGMQKANILKFGCLCWNKGLTKDTSETVKHACEKLHQRYVSGELIGSFTGKHHSNNTKSKLSKNALEKNFSSHFGFRKSFLYKGIKFQSSYEVKLAKDLDSNNIEWIKPSYGLFKYKDNSGKTHTYTPDFYLPKFDVYLDPKNNFLINHINPTLGYKDSDKIKWVMEQNKNIKVLILSKNQLSWRRIKQLLVE